MTMFSNFQYGSSFYFWALRSSLSRVFMYFLTTASSHGEGLPFTFSDVNGACTSSILSSIDCRLLKASSSLRAL